MKPRLKKLLAAPFVFIAAIIILLEDWLWDDLARIAAAIGRLPVFRQLETFITGLPPYGALATLAVPSLLLVPVKLAALWFIAHGQSVPGLATVVVAKFAGTALVARIFMLTQPKLLRIGWFAWLHARLVAFKARLYAAIKASVIYQAAHRWSVPLKMKVREWMRRNRRNLWQARLAAAFRFSRRWKRSEEQKKSG